MKIVQIISLLIFISSFMIAQNGAKAALTDDEINELTSRLVMKLLLNDSQKSSVISLLKSYSLELDKINSGGDKSSYKNNEELVNATNSKIKAQLDSKQKMKFDVLEKDWWNSIHNEEKD